MRWGELADVRPKDLDLGTRIVTVSRTVVELNARYHPEGKHFLLKEQCGWTLARAHARSGTRSR
jgi:hypothetical protein